MIDKATSEKIVEWLRQQPEVESLTPICGEGDEGCMVCDRMYAPESVMFVEDTGTVCFHCLHNLAQRVLNPAQ